MKKTVALILSILMLLSLSGQPASWAEGNPASPPGMALTNTGSGTPERVIRVADAGDTITVSVVSEGVSTPLAIIENDTLSSVSFGTSQASTTLKVNDEAISNLPADTPAQVDGNISSTGKTTGVTVGGSSAESKANLTINGSVTSEKTGMTASGFVDVTVTGSITGNNTGVEIPGTDMHDVTVNGNIISDGTGVNIPGLGGSADKHVKINGSITSKKALNAYSTLGGKLDVDINGDISATDTAVYASSLDQSKTDITVTGDITSNYYGIDARSGSDQRKGGTSNVTVTGDVYARVIAVQAETKNTSGEINITVNGDLSGINEKQSGQCGVQTNVASESAAHVTINGDIYDDRGISSRSIGGDSVVKQYGDIYANGMTLNHIGVTSDSSNNGLSDVYVEGNVTAVGDGIIPNIGITAVSSDGGTAKVKVTGDITATGDNTIAYNTDSEKTGIKVENAGGTADVEVGGDLTAKGTFTKGGYNNSITGVIIDHDAGDTEVTVNNITAQTTRFNSDYARGMKIQVDDGTAIINVNGDITAKGTAYSESLPYSLSAVFEGINVTSTGGKTEISVTGNVKTDADFYGINSRARGLNIENNGGTIIISVGGDVEAEGTVTVRESDGDTKENFEAIRVNSNSGSSDILVAGSVSSSRTGMAVTGNEAADGNTVIRVEGNLSGEETGIRTANNGSGITAIIIGGQPLAEEADGDLSDGGDSGEEENGAAENPVSDKTGNLNAGKTGIEITAAKSNTDIYLDGILKVAEGGTPVLLGSGITETDTASISITVWKIEGWDQEAGNPIVRQADAEDGTVAKTVQESINYIIKINPAVKTRGGTITTYDAAAENEIATARENEKVIIKVTVPEGSTDISVTNGYGEEIPITATDDDGNLYLVVEPGGGIYLNATWTAPSTEPEPGTEPTTDPTTDPNTNPTTDPNTNPTTDPNTNPNTNPTTDPTTEPNTNPNTNPTTDPTTNPTTEPITNPTTDPTTDPANSYPGTAPTTDSGTNPNTDPATDPTTNAQTIPIRIPVTEPQTETDTNPGTEPNPNTKPQFNPITDTGTEPQTNPQTVPNWIPVIEPDSGNSPAPENPAGTENIPGRNDPSGSGEKQNSGKTESLPAPAFPADKTINPAGEPESNWYPAPAGARFTIGIEVADSLPGEPGGGENNNPAVLLDEKVVIGTDRDTGEPIVKPVEEVLNTDRENAAFLAAADAGKEDNNAAFAAAAASSATVTGGTVDFGGAFGNALEEELLVPVSVPITDAGTEYTVVYSDGRTATLKSETIGELIIPFPRDAAGISFVVQDDFSSRYADLIENYQNYGESTLAGRTPETQARVRAYAAEKQ